MLAYLRYLVAAAPFAVLALFGVARPLTYREFKEGARGR